MQVKISYYSYTLKLKQPFTIATGTRNSTPIVLVELTAPDGTIGYGEASLPPYLGESQQGVFEFLENVVLNNFDPEKISGTLEDIDKSADGNNASKAALDMALHDLSGKLLNKSCFELLGVPSENFPLSSYTIGIVPPENIKNLVKEMDSFQLFKLKLGGGNDVEMIKTYAGETSKPFSVDVNQGWTNKYKALDLVKMLEDLNCEYIEQPFPKEMIRESIWLGDRTRLPLIADEAAKRLEDIPQINGVYHGINIKLMKSTGLAEAKKMTRLAKEKKMKIVIGSMTETSCGITAAAHLSPLADWTDLDSSWLVSEDPFEGAEIRGGRIFFKNILPGLSLAKKAQKNPGKI